MRILSSGKLGFAFDNFRERDCRVAGETHVQVHHITTIETGISAVSIVEIVIVGWRTMMRRFLFG